MTTNEAAASEPLTAQEFISEQVIVRMHRARLSQVELAPLLRMGQSSLSKRINNERSWTVDDLITLSRLFKVPLDALVPGPEYEPIDYLDERLAALHELRERDGVSGHEPGGRSYFTRPEVAVSWTRTIGRNPVNPVVIPNLGDQPSEGDGWADVLPFRRRRAPRTAVFGRSA